jgi:hypothetical protein
MTTRFPGGDLTAEKNLPPRTERDLKILDTISLIARNSLFVGGLIDHALHRGEPGGGVPFEKGVAGEQNEGDCRLSQSPRLVAPQAVPA